MVFFTFCLIAVIIAPEYVLAKENSQPDQPVKAMRIQTRVVPEASKDTGMAFDDEIESLKAKLQKEKNINARYSLLLRASNQLTKIKAGPRPQSEEKSLEMALILETFEGLPTKKSFNAKKCSETIDQATSRMKNLSSDGPEDPGVTKASALLQMICQ
jgi:hypothetical protein